MKNIIQEKKFYTARYESMFMATIVKPKKPLLLMLETIIGEPVYDFTVLNSKLMKSHFYNKGQTVDLLVKTEHDYINVELNTNFSEEYKNRNMYYAFKVAIDTLEKRKELYRNPYRTIQANINFGKTSSKELIETIALYNETTQERYSDLLIFKNINIDNYRKKYYNDSSKLTKEEMQFLILDLEEEELKKLSEEDEMVREFYENLDKANDEDINVQLASPEVEQEIFRQIAFDHGKAEGIEKGIEEGIEKGIEKGKKQGLKQGEKKGAQKAKIETAKKMLKENIDIQLISKVTGLSIKRIQELKHD